MAPTSEAGSGFVLVGGPPALDLVATFGRRHAGGVERLPDQGPSGAGPSRPDWSPTPPRSPSRISSSSAAAGGDRGPGPVVDGGGLEPVGARAGAVHLVERVRTRPDLAPQLVVDEHGRYGWRLWRAGLPRCLPRSPGTRSGCSVDRGPLGSRNASIRTARVVPGRNAVRPAPGGARWSGAATRSRPPVTGPAAARGALLRTDLPL